MSRTLEEREFTLSELKEFPRVTVLLKANIFFFSSSSIENGSQCILGEKQTERLTFCAVVFGYRTGVGKGQGKPGLRRGTISGPVRLAVSS